MAYAVREGARVGATLGNGGSDPDTVDPTILAAVQRGLTDPILIENITSIQIFKASTDGQPIGGRSTPTTASATSSARPAGRPPAARHRLECGLDRDRPELRIDLVEPLAVRDRVRLPARAGQHDVALGEVRIVGGATSQTVPASITPPTGTGARRTDRRSCARAYRDRARARSCAAGLHPRQASELEFLQAKIGWLGFADGTRGENDAFALGHDGFLPDYCSSHCEVRGNEANPTLAVIAREGGRSRFQRRL